MTNPQRLLVLLVTSTLPAVAQDTRSADSLPPLQALESRQVHRAGRTITYQRVAPPVQQPKPAATPAPIMEPGRTLPLTAERQRRAAKKVESLFLTATVHDQRVTELRWHQQGREHRAWSNIDFNHLAGVSELETADHIYQVLLGVTNHTAAQVAALNQALTARGLPATALKPTPPAIPWSVSRAEYLLTSEAADATPPAEVATFLNTLHLYYDANRTFLAEQAATRAAEQAARAEAERLKAAQPKRTVIRFWQRPRNVDAKSQN